MVREGASESEHQTFPKPAPRCKHLWSRKLKTSDGAMQYCRLGCGKSKDVKAPKPIERGAPPRARSTKASERVKNWPQLREAVYERAKGTCFWCGMFCPLDQGTAEHAIPANPANGGKDVETNLNWCHHKPFPRSCHGAKSGAGARGQVKALRWLATWWYREEVHAFAVNDDTKTREDWIIERNRLRDALECVQIDIDAGKRPPTLEVRKP